MTQRVVGVQWDDHLRAALDRLVDTMVEELAEEREELVVRRRQADVGGHVGDEQRVVRRCATGRYPGYGCDCRLGFHRRIRSRIARTSGIAGTGSLVHGTAIRSRPACARDSPPPRHAAGLAEV